MAESKKLLGHLALLGVAVFYSGNYIIAQDVMHGGFIPPMAFVSLRVMGSVILFWVFGFFFKSEKIIFKDFMYLCLCSIVGIGLAQYTFFLGLEKTPTINASLLICATPIFVSVLSVLFLKEKLTIYKIMGMVLAAAGAITLLSARGEFQLGNAYFQGNLLIILNAFTYGLYLVMIRPLVIKYHPFTVVKWVFTVSLPFVIPLSWDSMANITWQAFTPYAWIGLVYVIIFATFLTYAFNGFSVKVLGSVISGLYLYLQPFMTTILSVFYEKDSLDAYKILAGILILTGLYLAAFYRKLGRGK